MLVRYLLVRMDNRNRYSVYEIMPKQTKQKVIRTRKRSRIAAAHNQVVNFLKQRFGTRSKWRTTRIH